MALVENLSPNPCLKVGASGWFGPSGWARVAFGDPSLPRDAVWTGTLNGDIATPRFSVTPGKYYRAAVWGRTVAPSIFSTGLNWYSTGGYIAYSAGNDYNQAGNTTAVFDSGVGLAPVGADEGLLNLAGIDGEAQFTALIVREFDTLGEASAADMSYFDGDTSGAVWDAGSDGTSTLDTGNSSAAAFTLPAPTLRVAAAQRTTAASAAFTLPGLSLSVGLTAQITYDDTRGRIRIQVDGLIPSVIRAVVYARRQGSNRWLEIRGGRVAVIGGSFQRTVDHYEFVAGTTMEYRVVGLSSPELVPDVVVQSRVLTIDAPLTGPWIKFIASPARNRKLKISGNGPVQRASRNAVYPVAGRVDPVVVTDVHAARTTSITAITTTTAEGEALDEALSSGALAFLHVPVGSPLPSMYVSVGDYQWSPAPLSEDRLWEIPITEVAAPPLSVVGVGVTYQAMFERYVSYTDAAAAFATYRDSAA